MQTKDDHAILTNTAQMNAIIDNTCHQTGTGNILEFDQSYDCS